MDIYSYWRLLKAWNTVFLNKYYEDCCVFTETYINMYMYIYKITEYFVYNEESKLAPFQSPPPPPLPLPLPIIHPYKVFGSLKAVAVQCNTYPNMLWFHKPETSDIKYNTRLFIKHLNRFKVVQSVFSCTANGKKKST